MDEEAKKRMAVFRFGVIADFVGGRALSRGEVRRLLAQKSAQRWEIPGSGRSRISVSTIKSWIARYRASGNRLESLYPKGRSDRGQSRTIDQETAQGLVTLRRELPAVSLPLLMQEARARQIIPVGAKVPYATLYRFLQSEGLLQKPDQEAQDRRRFEAADPNDLWQADVLHGPPVLQEGKQRKTYLIAFIDDMSRLAVHAEFYLHERLESFLDALRKALLMRGLPRKLYVDNGAAFRCHHLEHICASLGIVLLHSRPYQPEGRGKMERWFRTVRQQFLSTAKASTLEELNDALRPWVAAYNAARHRTTQETPVSRFSRHIECIRPAPKDLEDHFRKTVRRTVAKDRTVALGGKLYEAPVALIGKQVMLLYHEHDPARVEVTFGGQTYGFIRLLDVKVNCRVKRGHSGLKLDRPLHDERYRGGRLFGADAAREEQG
ncbi:MAG: DDE-type integrase/transposase/recombinase [Nitrospirota bacterium]